jgi:general secretion pathway protein G
MKLACPYCTEDIQYDEGLAGTAISCPWCHRSLKMPSLAELPPERRREYQEEKRRRDAKARRKAERTQKRAEAKQARAERAEQAERARAERAKEAQRRAVPVMPEARPGTAANPIFQRSRLSPGAAIGRVILGCVSVPVVCGFVLLVGFVLAAPLIFGAREKAERHAAKVQILKFQAALDTYKFDTGSYPSAEEGLEALIQRPPDVNGWPEEGLETLIQPERRREYQRSLGWLGPYLDEQILPKDPWGNDYQYAYPSMRPPGALPDVLGDYESPDIWSFGPDGQDNTEDDICSWLQEPLYEGTREVAEVLEPSMGTRSDAEQARERPVAPSLPHGEWETVQTWRGNGMKQTESFYIAQREWRIRWSMRSTSKIGLPATLSVRVYRDDGEYVCLALNQVGDGSDITHVRSSPGQHYLDIDGTLTDWTVSVEERR